MKKICIDLIPNNRIIALLYKGSLIDQAELVIQHLAGLFDNLLGVVSLGFLYSCFEMDVCCWSVRRHMNRRKGVR